MCETISEEIRLPREKLSLSLKPTKRRAMHQPSIIDPPRRSIWFDNPPLANLGGEALFIGLAVKRLLLSHWLARTADGLSSD
jgi:hypothetical protein